MKAAYRPSTTTIVICAALIVTLAMGIRQSFGLFLPGVSADLGVGRQSFGFAVAVQNLIFGLIQPFVGALADRKGSGKIVAVGAVVYVIGLVLAGMAGGAGGLTLSLGLLVGLALSGTTFVVVFGPVARAVPPEKRSQVLGLVTAGGSLGQFLVVPAAQAALSAFDWRVTFTIMAGLAAVMCLLALGVSGKPQASTTDTTIDLGLGSALRGAARDRDFWLLNLGFFVCGFHIAFVGTHLPAYLVDKGLAPSIGAWCLALVGLFNIAGSFAWGAWGGRYPKARLLSILYAARGVAIIAFLAAPLSPGSALMFAAAFGFLWLGTVPLTSGLVGQVYGVRYLSTLYGIVFLSHQIGSFIGAWWAGAMFDATGGYDGVWLTAIALAFAAALIHLPISERPRAVQAA
jgi:MFS family permease